MLLNLLSYIYPCVLRMQFIPFIGRDIFLTVYTTKVIIFFDKKEGGMSSVCNFEFHFCVRLPYLAAQALNLAVEV